ncbi:hypothetical protein M3J09_006444 [Ascochyta lentis]
MEQAGAVVLSHHFRRWRDDEVVTRPLIEEFYCSILFQLLEMSGHTPYSICQSWHDALLRDQFSVPWTIAQLRATIFEIILTRSKTGSIAFRLFIDGLDACRHNSNSEPESKEPLEVLGFVESLLSKSHEFGLDIRVCISRRHIPDYENIEPSGLAIVVEENIGPAVDSFIKSRLHKIKLHQGVKVILYHKMIRYYTREFYWPKLVMDNIASSSQRKRPSEILKIVDEELDKLAVSLPQDENGKPYTRLIGDSVALEQFQNAPLFEQDLMRAAPYASTPPKGVPESDGMIMLQIVIEARRLLTLDEFRLALPFVRDIEFDNIERWENSAEGWHPEAVETFESHIREASQALIEVDRSTGACAVVRTMHRVVPKFLRSQVNAAIGQTFSKPRCNRRLLGICLRALDFCPCTKKDEFSFISYAEEAWIYHARDCGTLLTLADIPNFLRDCSGPKAVSVITRLISKMKKAGRIEGGVLSDNEGMLVLTATVGCTRLLELHLETCATCRRYCSDFSNLLYRRALYFATLQCHVGTLSRLLQKPFRGDINSLSKASGSFESTLLYDACVAGNLEVVKLLLDEGADPTTPSSDFYVYPLHVSIEYGHSDLIPSLTRFKTFDQFTLRGRNGRTALHCAIESDQKSSKLKTLRTTLEHAPEEPELLELVNDEGENATQLAGRMANSGAAAGEEVEAELREFCHKVQRSQENRAAIPVSLDFFWA